MSRFPPRRSGELSDDLTPQLSGTLDGQGNDLINLGTIKLVEQAAAEADTPASGQIWVLTATPNVLKYTDDAGNDWTPAMAENLASTGNGLGAALIGIEDTNGYFTGATVEAALVEAIEYAEPLGKLRSSDEVTDNYTFVLTDNGKTKEMNAATAKAFTIPTNASVAFPVDTYLNCVRIGTGAVTVVGATGVTVNGVSAGTVTIAARYGSVTLYKRGTDEWIAPNAVAV